MPEMEAAGRGRYRVYVKGSAAPANTPARAVASGESVALPRVKSVTGRGIRFSSGADTFGGLREMRGGPSASVPVAMTMAQARAAAKRGMLGGVAANAGADRLALGPSMLMLRVDFSDIKRLGNSFANMGIVIQKGHGVIAKSINEGVRRFETGVKRDLVQWTGVKNRKRVAKGFSRTFASAATMTARVQVVDRHMRVTSEYFNAKWNRGDPGGTHRAWNRPQLARGTFFIKGEKPLFKREGVRVKLADGEWHQPVAPLWGPNVVREIMRHEGQVRGRLAVVQVGVQQTAVRLMKIAIERGRR